MTHMSSTQFHKQCSAIKQMSRYVDNRSLFVIFTQVEIVKSVHDKVLYLTLILNCWLMIELCLILKYFS